MFLKIFTSPLNFNNLDLNTLNFSIINCCILLILVNIVINILFFRKKVYKNQIRLWCNSLFYISILCLFFFKFFINLFFLNKTPVSSFSGYFLKYSYTNSWDFVIGLNSGLLSDSVVLLGLVIGWYCQFLLNNKKLFNSFTDHNVFFIFILCIIFMVYTTNLLIMFISFEFLFFPTIYYIFRHTYSKKSNKALKFLIIWTLLGTFIVLFNLSYIFGCYGTLDFKQLNVFKFTTEESLYIYMGFFLGFAVKIPLTPFQYWLLKIHVEVPTGFSLFLSGFLVKAAIYCLSIVGLLFQTKITRVIVICWIIISLFIATVSLFIQTDIKRLIAWATVQEMTTILLLLFIKGFDDCTSIILFMFFHGLVSVYMFFIIDIIERRFSTRQTSLVVGIASTMPKLKKYIFILIILSSGFPLTVKFWVEWELFSIFLNISPLILFTLIIIYLLSIVAVCKFFFNLLYGFSGQNACIVDLTFGESRLLNSLLFLLFLLFFFLGYLY